MKVWGMMTLPRLEIEMTLTRLRQLCGNDRLEALRVLNEMQAELLANGGA